MIVVYLSNQNIRVAEGEFSRGTVKINGLYCTVDTEGCIINGSIMDREGLKDLLQNLWEQEKLEKKDVALVLNSSQFTMRVLDVPVMKPVQTMEYIRREFADVERIEDPVYAYFPMPGQKKGKVQTMLAGVAPRAFLEGYRQLFEEMGIHLTRIEPAQSPLFRMIDNAKEVRGRTCIVQLISVSTLMSVLFVDGKHMYSSRSRLFSDPDTPEFAVETARAVSNILQFSKSQNIPAPVREVFVAGMNQETMEVFTDSVRRIDENLDPRHLELERIFELGGDCTPQELELYVLSLGAFWSVPNKLDFLAQTLYDPEAEERKAKRRRELFPLAVLAAVMICAAAGLGAQMFHLSGKLKAIQAYNEDPDVVEACQRYDSVLKEINTRRGLLVQAEKLEQTLEGYPVVDSRTEAVVASCARGLVNASVTSYQAREGILSIDTTADKAEKIHLFVGKLGEQEIFEEINYTGYRQTSEGSWAMTIECRMRGIEVTEDDTETD